MECLRPFSIFIFIFRGPAINWKPFLKRIVSVLFLSLRLGLIK
ncbi:hypothetical protein LEP1GSC132_4128 [Leptospira kirschneri str. 200803703]|nr:hypothetical protein LEP1GSC132_4128 [Leptospira kirschneri str. 200803703]